MSNQDTERAAFEAWCSTKNLSTQRWEIGPYADGGYGDLDTRNAWRGWQARATAPEVAQEEPVAFMSPEQVQYIVDPDEDGGTYIPLRKKPRAKFTMPLFAGPALCQERAALIGSDQMVPRDLLIAACHAIRAKKDAPIILEQLRRYTFGDLSRAAPQDDSKAPAAEPRTPLTEAQIVRCLVAAGCVGTVKMSFDSGPYEITRTSVNADRFARAIETAHGIGAAAPTRAHEAACQGEKTS